MLLKISEKKYEPCVFVLCYCNKTLQADVLWSTEIYETHSSASTKDCIW